MSKVLLYLSVSVGDIPSIPSPPPQESTSKVASPIKPCSAEQEKPAYRVANPQGATEGIV